MENNIIINIIENNDIFNKWHEELEITFKRNENVLTDTFLRVKETIMGCNVMQINGVSTRYFKYIKDDFLKILEAIANEENYLEKLNIKKPDKKYFLKRNANVFICTLGYIYYGNEKYLLDMGFKLVNEYQNKAHGLKTTDKQRLYILIL